MERVLADEAGFAIGASVSSVDEIDTLDGAGAYGVAVVAISPRDGRSCGDIVINVSKVARPVVISTWDNEEMLWDVIRAGARGCVTRSCDQREMVMALRIAATGALYVSPGLMGLLHEQLGRPRRPGREATVGLAPREIETVRLISLGLTQRQIATRMGLSEATVNTYAKRIRSKLKVGNKAELTRAAIGLGLVSDDCGDRHHYAA
jgi:DNA-binding NarL/FixJ family response regulator